MSRWEHLRSSSAMQCCMCDHHLSVRDLEEFYGRADEGLQGEAYCRLCRETHLRLCRECSTKYTAEPAGICSDCSAGMYGLVG
jgi:hypothetical protein